jgi:hypothetical protein
MRDISDRYQVQPLQNRTSPKKIGNYLVDAGLLTTDQINVVLNDQQATGMRFGEIIVARGWLKEQTVEWIVNKVIEPERRVHKRREQMPKPWPTDQAAQSAASHALEIAPTVKAPGNPPRSNPVKQTPDTQVAAKTDKLSPQKTFVRREAPIAKPLPSVSSSDGDVNWVG